MMMKNVFANKISCLFTFGHFLINTLVCVYISFLRYWNYLGFCKSYLTILFLSYNIKLTIERLNKEAGDVNSSKLIWVIAHDLFYCKSCIFIVTYVFLWKKSTLSMIIDNIWYTETLFLLCTENINIIITPLLTKVSWTRVAYKHFEQVHIVRRSNRVWNIIGGKIYFMLWNFISMTLFVVFERIW